MSLPCASFFTPAFEIHRLRHRDDSGRRSVRHDIFGTPTKKFKRAGPSFLRASWTAFLRQGKRVRSSG